MWRIARNEMQAGVKSSKQMLIKVEVLRQRKVDGLEVRIVRDEKQIPQPQSAQERRLRVGMAGPRRPLRFHSGTREDIELCEGRRFWPA